MNIGWVFEDGLLVGGDCAISLIGVYSKGEVCKSPLRGGEINVLGGLVFDKFESCRNQGWNTPERRIDIIFISKENPVHKNFICRFVNHLQNRISLLVYNLINVGNGAVIAIQI